MKPRPISNPPNPFAGSFVEYFPEHPPAGRLTVLEDATRSIVTHNDSPDVGFRWSANPYRGCIHACAYCFARPTHEYLDMGAGTDFDTRIVAKPRAAALLRDQLEKPSWRGERIAFSTSTDPYLPLEASMGLTRACLEVCLEYRQPVGISTKAALLERDLDLLGELGRRADLRVSMSLPFLDAEDARALEPWAPSPARRLETVRRLAAAGLRVNVAVAPVIPGLNDDALPKLLAAAKDAGAKSASWILLRLPGSVKEVFETRLREAMPGRAERVLHRIRETHGGVLADTRFGTRQTGEGPYAEAIERLFRVTAKRLRLGEHAPDGPTTFRRPDAPGRQLGLFER